MYDSISIQIFSPLQLFELPDVERLFAALEEKPEIAPGHWGESAALRDPYDRADIVRYMRLCQSLGQAAYGARLTIRRLTPPRYNLHTTASYTSLMMPVELTSVRELAPEDIPLYFDLGSRLASALEAEYGYVDIIHAGLKVEQGERQFYPHYPEAGPYDIRRRTFFGPRLLELMGGSNALTQTGLRVLPCGHGLQLDVSETPWTGDAATVLATRRAATNVLRKTGVFAREDDGSFIPGPRWVPMPQLKPPQAAPRTR